MDHINSIQINELSASYGNHEVLKGIDLTIFSKECLVLLGPSGCGKSTLLSVISGLKQANNGTIKFGDQKIYCSNSSINVPVEERNIGVVFQSYALWPHLSVYENIAYPLKVRKFRKNEIRKKVDSLLEMINLSGYENKYPYELSGGEKQRVAIGRALVYEPRVLLLDEPLANIDAQLKSHLLKEMRQIQKTMDVTMIYVTHDQAEAFEIGDRIAIMQEGCIQQIGSPEEIYHKGKNKFVAEFIGKNNILSRSHKRECRFMDHHCKCKGGPHEMIAIRPEKINLDTQGQYRGRISKVHFKGERTEYIIVMDDVELLAISSEQKYKVGDLVSFNILSYQVI